MRYRYFVDRHGISVFANFCYGIAVLGTIPPCPPPRGTLTKCQYVWLRRTLHCPSCLQVRITVGMIPHSCLLVGSNYCLATVVVISTNPPPPTFPTPDKPNICWGASAITGQHSQQLTLLFNSVMCYEY